MGYDVGICKVKWKRPASSYIDGKQVQTKEYAVWRAMMQRQRQGYKNKGYEGVIVVGDFTDYDLFYDWLVNQVGYGEKDDKGQSFQLDKDLLGDGLSYSKEHCLLLPREINNATIKPKTSKDLPTGVYKASNRFSCRISRYNVESTIGYYDSAEDASKAYKKAKASYLKDLAHKWKDKIDQRAYLALVDYGDI
jgi:hypothetical protein